MAESGVVLNSHLHHVRWVAMLSGMRDGATWSRGPSWSRAGTEELVSRDPQLPQSFVPTTRHTIWPGDRLTVTCLFDSSSKCVR